MNALNWSQVVSDKERLRTKLAELPFGDKLRMLDQLRERDEPFAAWRSEARGRSNAEPVWQLVIVGSINSALPIQGSINANVLGADDAFVASATPPQMISLSVASAISVTQA